MLECENHGETKVRDPPMRLHEVWMSNVVPHASLLAGLSTVAHHAAGNHQDAADYNCRGNAPGDCPFGCEDKRGAIASTVAGMMPRHWITLHEMLAALPIALKSRVSMLAG
jgi:hypothetical protein